MAEQKIKFKVSIKELSFEFEGTREVGQAIHAGLNRSLGTLLDTPRTVMAIPAATAKPPAGSLGLFDTSPDGDEPTDGRTTNGDATNGHAPPAVAAVTEKTKKPRKSPGPQLKALLRGLKKDGYFAEPRTLDAVREKLKDKGHSTKPSTVSSRLQEMVVGDELHRQKSGDGYVYKDTKFDDLPRTPNPLDAPAE